jgi:hypothetical protein
MSAEEERLSWLLKRAVPEPPSGINVDQVTSRRPADRSVKSWALPALAAAAVVAIAVTIGVLGQRGPRPAAPAAAGSTGTAGTSQPAASTSPQPAATCPGATVVVPDVIGTTEDAAAAILQGAGLNAGIYDAVPPAGHSVPVGTVFKESPAAGSKAVPRAVVWLAIAVAPSTSTAPPIDPGFAPTQAPTQISVCLAASGSPPAQGTNARVPNVVGMTQLQAVAVAQAAGFNVSVSHTAPPAGQSVPPGTVFAQVPAAGTTARPGSGMILFVPPAQ